MNVRPLPLLLAIIASLAIPAAQAATTGTLRFAGQINAGTCNLAAKDVNRTITLPTVKVSDFDNISVIGATEFDITAECESDIRNVTFLFTGTPDTLIPAIFASTGTAKGVAVRIRAGTPTEKTVMYAMGIPIQRSRTIATASKQAVLSVEAAYQKNTAPLAQGTVDSTVTISITYS
jgi:major type 1 subunit fimbrin (pilin)